MLYSLLILVKAWHLHYSPCYFIIDSVIRKSGMSLSDLRCTCMSMSPSWTAIHGGSTWILDKFLKKNQKFVLLQGKAKCMIIFFKQMFKKQNNV